ncbi:hypothetical protein [Bacillus sp. 105MF]|uniref:hypothetical protein n=1 Tax=Bacillus sp. 105MF TaxID=1151120 RepID=UPI0003672414|nr:hypothetical protein [Bacillus sp. 105MF]
MSEEQEYCSCENSSGVYSEWIDNGTWDYCDDCKKKIDGSFCYDNEPMIDELI